ncbi:MAG: HAMP domain-containing sensor histidine kinase, partial [Undibacterium sp.]|nr:HAMP domain-containing sensor histidine kinase [Undibacterium sp.]
GISEANLKKVFDPFFTTKFGQGGSGLGMHIVYNLVTEVLGGSIDIVSLPGQGTRVTMRFPLSAPEALAPANLHT